jgi:GcrA cell cycle regulator
MEWTEEAVATLKRLWAEGGSARAIGETLGGISRNAVIGKAHRLGLSNKTKPAVEEPAPKIVDTGSLTERMCRWPIGHPGEPGFRFCGDARIASRPYCAEHCALAYRGKAEAA